MELKTKQKDMNYTAHTKHGIGEVISNDGKFLEVYYEEVDKTFKTILAFSPKTYETYEMAEAVLEGKEEAIEMGRERRAIEDEKAIKDGMAAQHRMEEIYIESSKNLMRNI